ncbi:hypothetical protein LINPERPRIM_LOCUS2989 [Linum perenne]
MSLTLSRRRDRRLRRYPVSTPHTTGRRSPLAATAALAIRAAPSPSAPLQSAAASRQSKFNHLRLIMAATRWIGSKLEVKTAPKPPSHIQIPVLQSKTELLCSREYRPPTPAPTTTHALM